jgi:hypothetical protein
MCLTPRKNAHLDDDSFRARLFRWKSKRKPAGVNRRAAKNQCDIFRFDTGSALQCSSIAAGRLFFNRPEPDLLNFQ